MMLMILGLLLATFNLAAPIPDHNSTFEIKRSFGCIDAATNKTPYCRQD